MANQALITVGRNVTYIDNIESDLDSETGIITYTVNTERILVRHRYGFDRYNSRRQ
jgi:hypothetical protein